MSAHSEHALQRARGHGAANYEELRPGYPESVATEIRRYLGRDPGLVVEVGAGTGKATAILSPLTSHLICIEPSRAMSEELARRVPSAQVVNVELQSWAENLGDDDQRADLVFGAMVWHLLPADERCRLAARVINPEGVLAVVGRVNQTTDPDLEVAINAAFRSVGYPQRPRHNEWVRDDLARSGLFGSIVETHHDTTQNLSAEDFCRLVTTFSPFASLSEPAQLTLLERLASVVGDAGGSMSVTWVTSMFMARPIHGTVRTPSG